MLNILKNNKLFLKTLIFIIINTFLLYYFCEIDLFAIIILVVFIYALPFTIIYILSTKKNEDIFKLEQNKNLKKTKHMYLTAFIFTVLYVIMSSALAGFIEHFKLMYDLKALIINDELLEIFKQSNTNSNTIPIAQIIRLFITSCLFAPFFEEIIFRGFLFKKLLKKIDVNTSIFISSFIFSLFYGLNVSGATSSLINISNIISTTIAGSMFCLMFLKFNNLKVCIISHSIMNFLCLIYKLWLPAWYQNLLLNNILRTTGTELFIFLLIFYLFVRYYNKNRDSFLLKAENK